MVSAVTVVVAAGAALLFTGANARAFYLSRLPGDAIASVSSWDVYAQHTVRLGAADRTVTAVIFMDYGCVACRKAMSRLVKLHHRHPSMLSVVIRQYPDRSNRFSDMAARAMVCSVAQGRLEAMNAALLKNPTHPLHPTVWTISDFVSVPDPARFAECLENSATDAAIARDIALAQQLPVTALPTVLIDGVSYGTGAGFSRVIKNRIDRLAYQSASAGTD